MTTPHSMKYYIFYKKSCVPGSQSHLIYAWKQSIIIVITQDTHMQSIIMALQYNVWC